MPNPDSTPESVPIYGDFWTYDEDFEEYLNDLEDREREEEKARLLIALDKHQTEEDYYHGCGGY